MLYIHICMHMHACMYVCVSVCIYIYIYIYILCKDLFLTNQVFSFQNIINIATGLSDFHKFVFTVLKTRFSQNKRKQISYRDYKNFNSNTFQDELHHAFSNLMIDTCDKFDNVFLEIFEQLCTFKKETTQGKSCFACF